MRSTAQVPDGRTKTIFAVVCNNGRDACFWRCTTFSRTNFLVVETYFSCCYNWQWKTFEAL